MSPKFCGKYGKTHMTCIYHFFLFRQCLAFVAKLYLTPTFQGLKQLDPRKRLGSPKLKGWTITRKRLIMSSFKVSSQSRKFEYIKMAITIDVQGQF